MFKDILRYLPSRLVPAIIAFFLNVFVFSRILRPSEYGYYMLVLTVTGIAGAVLFKWIEESGLRYFVNLDRKQKNLFLSTHLMFIIMVGLAVVASVLVMGDLLADFVDVNFLGLLKIGVWLIVVKSLFDFFMAISRASFKKIKYSLYSVCLALGKLLMAVLVLYYTDLRVNGLIASLIVLYSVLVVLETRNHLGHRLLKPRFSLRLLKGSWKFGFPLTGVLILGLLLAAVDQFFIVHFLGARELGVYSLGYKISEMGIQNVYMVLMLPAYPVIVKKFEREGSFSAGRSIKGYMEWYLLLLAPLVFGLWGISKEFCELFLGSQYFATHTVVGLIASGIFLLGLSQYVLRAFLLLEKTKEIFYFLSVSLVANVLLNIILIPAYGIIGAALATFISYLVYITASYLMIKRGGKFPLSIPWDTFLKALVASGCMLVFLVWLPDSETMIVFLLKIGGAGGVYFLVLIIIRERNLRAFFKKTGA